VASLIDAGARPVVISPALCQTLQERADQGQIEAIGRAYQPGDLAGARLVVAATDDAATNEAVWNEAQALGCLVNVVDDPPHCNVHIPATLRRGALTISISTGGNSPSLARRIRQALEQQVDAAYEPYLDLLGELRPLVQEQVADPGRRKALWEALLDSEVLALLRAGEPQAAQQRAQEIVASFQ
jgi:precorrin-2 dehydrogenase/sirohydrochlorin ferrochelatase